jgi:hypothetical protein
MADKKISALTGASTPLAGTEVLPIVQGGATVQVSVANLTAGRAISTTAITASSINFGSTPATAGAVRLNNNDQAVTARNAANSGNVDVVYLDNVTILTAGNGVSFTANTPAAGMTSQLLNWYEEGTWTPVPTNLTVVGTPTYTGTYVRTGRVVYIILEVTASTSTTSTANSTYFTGLPFTIAIDSVINSVGANAITSPGSGLITKFSGGRVYTPTWGATGTVELSGFYFV